MMGRNTLHSENAKLSLARLNRVAAAHGSVEGQAEVPACVRRRDDAVVLEDVSNEETSEKKCKSAVGKKKKKTHP